MPPECQFCASVRCPAVSVRWSICLSSRREIAFSWSGMCTYLRRFPCAKNRTDGFWERRYMFLVFGKLNYECSYAQKKSRLLRRRQKDASLCGETQIFTFADVGEMRITHGTLGFWHVVQLTLFNRKSFWPRARRAHAFVSDAA